MNETQEQDKNNKRDSRAFSSVDQETMDIFTEYCRACSIKPTSVPKTQREDELKAAKELIDAGYSPDEVFQCAAELKRGWWKNKTLRLRNVAAEIAQWKAATYPINKAPPVEDDLEDHHVETDEEFDQRVLASLPTEVTV
jgi:hypothetical protein